MSQESLPARPSLEQLRKQAKELLQSFRNQNSDSVALFAKHHPVARQEKFALHDAQLVLARHYGFASWAKLKNEVVRRDESAIVEKFKAIVRGGSAGELRRLLTEHPGLRSRLDEPLFSFDSPAIRIAAERKDRDLIGALLEAGADINKRSEWKAGSFGVLDNADAGLGEYLISRGAKVDIHAAAGLGKLDRIAELLAQDPALVNARGGDGGTPLHFAKHVAVIDLLLERGADVTIRDLDHGSTAAMWQIQNRENLYRLIEAGSPVDIFMACRHGDLALAKRALREDPSCLDAVIGKGKFTRDTGGDIYIWKIANRGRPLTVAAQFKHRELVELLLAHAPAHQKFVFRCLEGDEAAARAILSEQPNLFERLTEEDLGAFPDAVWHGNTAAVRLFLSFGFPLTGRGADDGSALHVAAWIGDAATVRELLASGLDIEDRNDIHGSTPLGWACHGAIHSGRRNGDHAAVVEALLAAGADATGPANKYGESLRSWATPPIAEALNRHGEKELLERANRFVLDAVSDHPARARRALEREPELARANLWTALVTGDVSAVRRAAKRDSAWINRRGGPHENWTPLHYVCFSRLQMDGAQAQAQFADCARCLLDAGADPNAAWSAEPWPDSPLSPLYGATGVNNHPALARLLLERGAEIDDGESVFHAAQLDHRECLEVLRAFGVSLGRHPRWKNTPLYFLLGEFVNQGAGWNVTLLGIRWLLDHGCDPNIPCGDDDETALHVAIRQGHDTEIIRWLLDAEADPNRADKNEILPLLLAHRAGRKDVVALLCEYGARDVELTARERFFAAAFSGDRSGALAILREHPGLAGTFNEEDRLALNRAAERGNASAVGTLLDAGFDISFKGTRQWGSTPLHIASWYGHAGVVELLLARGAPIDVPANPPEESPPLGWAAHGSGNCRNPRGDYPRVVRALLAAGAHPHPAHAEMASPEVADVFHAALAGGTE